MAKQNDKSVRTTISIPASLKARMDAVDEPINWSAVAATAFERRLAEVITKRGAKDMQEVLARLRASKAKAVNQTLSLGIAMGERWAKQTASWDQLRRLDDSFLQLGQDMVESVIREEYPNSGSSVEPWQIIFNWTADDSLMHDRTAAITFWSMVDESLKFWHPTGLGSGTPFAADFLIGFVEGALKIWIEVKDQL
jgi:hypothetical protein